MSSSIQSFIKSLNEVPEGKFPPHYYTPLFIRSIVFGNYSYPSGILSHFLFLVIFALMGVTVLAILIYSASFFLRLLFFSIEKDISGWLFILLPSK